MPALKRTRRAVGVLGSFVHIDAAVEAIKALRARGHRDVVVYSAAPNHELEEALDQPVSPVRLFTLVVGGKTISSVPAYVVIGFELTILLGALSTVAAMVLFSVVMGKRGIAYDPRYSDDLIGIFVPAKGDQQGAVEQLLRSAGAVEVRHEAA
jgi:hypothetical protein